MNHRFRGVSGLLGACVRFVRASAPLGKKTFTAEKRQIRSALWSVDTTATLFLSTMTPYIAAMRHTGPPIQKSPFFPSATAGL